jgi:iron(III) transport system ATP-binding protein
MADYSMMLDVSHLYHIYDGQPVLQNVGFVIHENEFVCLTGVSGCGKSTLLRLIAGFEKPDSGVISLGRKTLSDTHTFVPPEQRKVGMVFQHPSLFPHLNVEKNVMFGMKPADVERAHNMLRQVSFSERNKAFPHQLSGGQQQRVALARALAADPKLLLLDEPFANLDFRLRAIVRDEMHKALKEAAIPTLMVTHEPQEALQLADRIVLLNSSGQVEQIGTPQELYLHPVSKYAATFFGPANILPPELTARLTGQAIAKNKCAVVRPEALRILPPEDASRHATVLSIRFAGSYRPIEAECEGITLLIHDRQGMNLSAGDQIGLQLDTKQIRLIQS